MRTVLVPTDFSKPSRNAAYFALHMAIALKADLHLCNAYTVPAESPMMGGVSWALYDSIDLQKDVEKGLKKFAKTLEKKEIVLSTDQPEAFHPTITYSYAQENLETLIQKTAASTETILTVMGMTGAGNLNRLVFGSSSLHMIEKTHTPLLIIPHHHRYKPIAKIAFATDLSKEDKKTVMSLAKLADYFNAELLIAHVKGFIDLLDEKAYQHKIETFIKGIEDKIKYLQMEAESVDSGLDDLRSGDLDLLVMGHQHKDFFDRLTMGSHSRRQTRKLHIPLMVIPTGMPVLF
ncbi:universal stress protein [Chryseobacterium koreense]|uniref:universal stress protein n=1 Tax=Chryseobacterium koreense TaxID=232216 RepID=UPI0026EE87FD|nr:universal stress protein [Chryseobacterium koreense]